MSEPNADPFEYQTQARLWAYGRWGQGGTVVLQVGDLQVNIELSAALFDVLAILICAAKKAEAETRWAPVGFLSTEELRRELTKLAGGTMILPLADSNNVVKAIYRVRKLIGEALFPKGEGDHYAKRLLEKTNLGYRLSTDPTNLHLLILGESGSGQDPGTGPVM
jgi:hypothetical protein